MKVHFFKFVSLSACLIMLGCTTTGINRLIRVKLLPTWVLIPANGKQQQTKQIMRENQRLGKTYRVGPKQLCTGERSHNAQFAKTKNAMRVAERCYSYCYLKIAFSRHCHDLKPSQRMLIACKEVQAQGLATLERVKTAIAEDAIHLNIKRRTLTPQAKPKHRIDAQAHPSFIKTVFNSYP